VVFKGGILGGVHQFWGNPYLNSMTVLFDIQSYLIHTPKSVLFVLKLKRKESIQLLSVHHFTLLCFSIDGLTGGEASSFIKRLASGLAAQWDKKIL